MSIKVTEPKLIPLYETIFGITCRRREESIARDIVNEAVFAGKNPFAVEVVELHGFLKIK